MVLVGEFATIVPMDVEWEQLMEGGPLHQVFWHEKDQRL